MEFSLSYYFCPVLEASVKTEVLRILFSFFPFIAWKLGIMSVLKKMYSYEQSDLFHNVTDLFRVNRNQASYFVHISIALIETFIIQKLKLAGRN